MRRGVLNRRVHKFGRFSTTEQNNNNECSTERGKGCDHCHAKTIRGWRTSNAEFIRWLRDNGMRFLIVRWRYWKDSVNREVLQIYKPWLSERDVCFYQKIRFGNFMFFDVSSHSESYETNFWRSICVYVSRFLIFCRRFLQNGWTNFRNFKVIRCISIRTLVD